MSRFKLLNAALAAGALVLACAAVAEPIPVKVVVVSMFENGEPTGDDPGEFQLWVERRKLDREFPFPLGEYALRMNDDGLLAICTGGGITNATASIMALGLDPRFDLSRAYWLVAGIAGGDPEDVSLGTAAWARAVVDGDLLYEIDGREIPEDWPYGLLPLGAKKPNDKADGWTVDTIHFPLNVELAEWAYALSKDHPVADSRGIAEFRKQFKGYPNAVKPPFVTMGESLSASTYWHGEKLNQWANDWVRLQAGADRNFMMGEMEDSGTLTALRRLSRTQRVDLDRVMVLRTASNYSMPPKGKTAAWSTTAPYPENGRPALEAAYQVGGVVVDELLSDWPRYRDATPSSN
ncbi:purine nucleoside permease [Algiphilus sp. W345]|uniref:Purine nucleoside permease n=1 Tax=Banduia mediterranea TaxID=3075609 RepID=A0ABU2WJS3_9GAMM|nr:purine nucleoside permease [Algiphilus sp. W345]MDT0498126.1 purine nucleoside permease [Algiphilus sp. W345]